MIDAENNWRSKAACASEDPELFFPTSKGTRLTDQVKEAKRICNSCDVKDFCLNEARDNEEPYGIWGGVTERERRKVIKRNARIAKNLATTATKDELRAHA